MDEECSAQSQGWYGLPWWICVSTFAVIPALEAPAIEAQVLQDFYLELQGKAHAVDGMSVTTRRLESLVCPVLAVIRQASLALLRFLVEALILDEVRLV